MEEKEEKDKKYPHTIEEIDAFWNEKHKLELALANAKTLKEAEEIEAQIFKLMMDF